MTDTALQLLGIALVLLAVMLSIRQLRRAGRDWRSLDGYADREPRPITSNANRDNELFVTSGGHGYVVKLDTPERRAEFNRIISASRSVSPRPHRADYALPSQSRPRDTPPQ